MEQEVYVVIRQNFHADNLTYYQYADDNPVVVVYESRDKVDDFFTLRLPYYIDQGYTYEHLENISSCNLVEKYIIYDYNSIVTTCYSVIKEYVL